MYYIPLYKFTAQAFVGLIRKGYLYWVEQSYPRGMELGIEKSCLLTPYTVFSKAQEHFNNIPEDPQRRLYSLDLKPGDPINKVPDGRDLIAVCQRSQNQRYYLPFTNGDYRPDRKLKEQIQEGAKRLGLGGAKQKVTSKLSFHYGKLVIRYLHENGNEMIPLDKIETY